MLDKKTLTDLDIGLLKEKFPNSYEEEIEKVKNGYPIQYLIGNVEFLNTHIKVSENVLIPRFETEYLVEKILKKVDTYKNDNLKCLDICTGSGCIAIAVSKNTNFKCVGTDISNAALKIALENANLNNVSIEFKQQDILNEQIQDEYDIIISNPPYIKKGDEVDISTKYEPQIALYALDNGLIFYKKILEKILNKPRLIAFEIGEKQGKDVWDLAIEKFPSALVTIEKDLCGKERYIFIEHM